MQALRHSAPRCVDRDCLTENFSAASQIALKFTFAGLISAERRTSARANTRIEEGDRDEHAASYTPRERVCSVRAADSHGIRGGRPPDPTIDSIDTQGCANDRVCVTLTVDNPVAGTITLKLTG